MTADRLLANTEQFGDLVGCPPQRRQPQDGQLPGCYGWSVSNLSRADHLFELLSSKSGGRNQKKPQWFRQHVGKDLAGPVRHQPALANATGQCIADAVFEREFIRPPLGADWP